MSELFNITIENGTSKRLPVGNKWSEKDIIVSAPPIPDEYIIPSGTKSITENGTHDVTEYASVDVNVAASGGDTLATMLAQRDGYYLFYGAKFTEIPLFDTSAYTTMYGAFMECKELTTVPLFDTNKVTIMGNMFYQCKKITTIPPFDTSNVTNMASMFNYCSALTTVPAFDARKVTNMVNMFSGCKYIQDIGIRNIKTNLQVASGTYWGHSLTVDCLIHLIYELRKQSSTMTLTIGTANLEKLANVYVKAIAITDEMRAEDDLIDEKNPFVVCESTDEGAMLITDYATTVKNWTIK